MNSKKQRRGKKAKRIMMLLMLATLALTPVYASAAGNYKDTWYYYDYSGDGSDFSIGSRAKLDYTSCYIKNLHRQFPILTRVFATNRESSDNYTLLKDCSVHPYLQVDPGEAKYVQNYVREWGYRYCTFFITPGTHDPAVFSGLWSPDSI